MWRSMWAISILDNASQPAVADPADPGVGLRPIDPDAWHAWAQVTTGERSVAGERSATGGAPATRTRPVGQVNSAEAGA